MRDSFALVVCCSLFKMEIPSHRWDESHHFTSALVAQVRPEGQHELVLHGVRWLHERRTSHM